MSSIRRKPIRKNKRGKGRKEIQESYSFVLLKYYTNHINIYNIYNSKL